MESVTVSHWSSTDYAAVRPAVSSTNKYHTAFLPSVTLAAGQSGPTAQVPIPYGSYWSAATEQLSGAKQKQPGLSPSTLLLTALVGMLPSTESGLLDATAHVVFS